MQFDIHQHRDLGAKDMAKELKDYILSSLHDDKAEDVIEIDLEGKTDFAHYMIVASGRSSRHASALAEKILEKLRKSGLKGLHTEGKEKGDWILIDAHDVIVHIFKPEMREVYNLEKMWGFEIV